MGKKELAEKVLSRLRVAIPEPETELHYRNPYELLIAVILSAQCTDERVNKITPDLFAAFPHARALAEAMPEDIFPYIKSCSYPNNKAKSLSRLGSELVDTFNGQVPESIEQLQQLPGVGSKTAQVVASVAFRIPAFPVDTHVFRVANRIGLSEKAPTVVKVEKQLKSRIPSHEWGEAHHLLILHGRYTCTAQRPKCSSCSIADLCSYFRDVQRLPKPRKKLDRSRSVSYCSSCHLYFDEGSERLDRKGVLQVACPRCDSMSVFDTKTGATRKKVKDYRV